LTAYIFTKAAEDYLRGIIRYTRKRWGNTQLKKYIATLEQCSTRLVSGKDEFKDMSALFPRLRMKHCEHHYIFCLPRDNAPALIIAIFHEHMDLMARLTDRLKI